jgi:5-methylcytosine-specific restriction endonuclease McrA
MAGGRPTKYRKEYCLAVEAFARLGLTDVKMAEKFGVSEVTLNAWKKTYPEFSECIKAGKDHREEPIKKKIRGSGRQKKRSKATSHEYYKKYYQENKLKYFNSAEKRRNQKNGVAFDLANNVWEEIKIYFNMSCAYCGVSNRALQKDHIVPLSKGGPYSYGNILPACGRCNASKQDGNMESWYKAQPYYDDGKLERITEYVASGQNIRV